MKRGSLVIGCALAMWLLSFAQAAAAQGEQQFAWQKDPQILHACMLDAPKSDGALQTRMPFIPFDKLTPAQKEVEMQEFTTTEADENHVASKTTKIDGMGGVYGVLGRDPEVLRHMKRLNVYLQDHSALPMKIRQFIVMMTARQWSVQLTYGVHCPQAVHDGLGLETARAISEGRRPSTMTPDEDIVYSLIDELHRNQSVSDETYARALEKYGEQGIVDIVSLNGWYTFFLMNVNVAREGRTDRSRGNIPMFPH